MQSRARFLGQRDPPADEVATGVVAEGAGQQAGPGEYLEPVADADDRAPGGDERAQRIAEMAGAAVADVEGEEASAPSASP